jgi:glutamate-5-semialdehyde dehydrogenase
LIRFVAENSCIPVIKHYKGVCCVYIDKDADPDLAEKIAVNAKVQRPSVCNAAENLFVHAESAPKILPRIARGLVDNAVELRGDAAAQAILLRREGLEVAAAAEEDFYEEYLDLILSIKIVSSLEEAIDAVNKYGSSHSDAIVTENEEAAQAFLAGVDSATVYWNASTRFTDGFEFGLGAEIGISTDKIHARGPMGLRELTSYKFLIYGEGQTK